MDVSRMVEFIACSTSGHVRRRCSAASTIAPTAPIAPASVGVARPSPIVPSTRKIRTIEGIIPQSTRLMSFQFNGSRTPSGSGRVWTDDRQGNHIEQEDNDLQDRGPDCAQIHVAYRFSELVG